MCVGCEELGELVNKGRARASALGECTTLHWGPGHGGGGGGGTSWSAGRAGGVGVLQVCGLLWWGEGKEGEGGRLDAGVSCVSR